jgi:hypothetical protein
MRWAGLLARWGRVEVYKVFWWETPTKSDHLEKTDVDGRIQFRWNFKNWDVRTWSGSMWFRIRTGGGHL